MLRIAKCNCFFSVLAILFFGQVHAQSTIDTSLSQKDTLTTTVKNIPHHLYLGLDYAKIGATFFNKNLNRIEAIAETELKNNNWLTAEMAFAHATFSNSNISYANRSYAMVFGIGKAFFKKEYSSDVDNGFASVSIGTARTTNGITNYTITDVWGTTTGTTPANTHQSYWLEFCSGVRFQVLKKVVVGWRVKGKVMLNQKVFTTTQPIYIASYGQGDKQAVFGYNFYITYKLY